jgi:DNA-binding protein H-NS
MESTKTLADIQAQIAQLQDQERQIREAEFASVVADIKEKMKQYGISISHIGFKDGSENRRSTKSGDTKKVAAKYRDDNGNSWSGRGLQPRWLSAAIEGGKSLKSFEISPENQPEATV